MGFTFEGAGTFAVLAGQTVTFHCNSPNLTAALVNSVTLLRRAAPGEPRRTISRFRLTGD